MRFATAAVVVFAGVAAAHGKHGEEAESTAYETQYFTVTSCAPEVTDCPARSTVVSSTVLPAVTTSAELPGVETPGVPAPSGPDTPGGPYESYSVPAELTPVPTLTPVYTSSALPVLETPGAVDCGAASIETISTYYTTVVPTVSYITHAAEACETTAPVVPGVPSTPTNPSNGTIPTTTPVTPIPTGGASTMGASAVLAVVAGLIAVFA
jgi:hypothetical protein